MAIAKKAKKKLVFVGMSGGVDSSVAALLLSDSVEARAARKRAGLPAGRQGYNIVGVFMRCWGGGPDAAVGVNCTAERDAEDARRVAEKLNIPFYTWDFEEAYQKKVVEYKVQGYKRGLTPNPDVMCNREIKFGLFLDKALSLGADYVATGHYVRLKKMRGAYRLYQAVDKNKDQSYFLWTLTQGQLAHCLFPIGDYLKPKVRQVAKRAGLPTAEKKDSQGICFLGQVTLIDFLKGYLPARSGAVLNLKGEKIGTHAGAHFYTIGQRQGLDHGTWNMKHVTFGKGDRKRFYIAEKNTKTNTIVVAEGPENPALFRKEIGLVSLNFISPTLHASRFTLHLYARVRYRQPLAEAILYINRSAPFDKLRVRLVFNQPQKFVAEGQSAVFYVDDPSIHSTGSESPRGTRGATSSRRSQGLRMLGGGVISD